MIEDQLGRCVASWYPGASGVDGAAKLSGGASQETWTFDIVHPDGNVGAILRRSPPGYGASPSPSRGVDLDGEAVLMQLAHDTGLPSPRVMHVLKPADELGRGFIAMLLYATMRTHFGAGPKTAVLAGIASWIAFSLTGPAQFIPLGFFSNALWMKVGAMHLVTSIVSTIVGAAMYKDAPRAATA